MEQPVPQSNNERNAAQPPATLQRNAEPNARAPIPQHSRTDSNANRNSVPQNPQKERNVILVGKKDTIAYVLAVVTQFNQGLPEIHIRARGKSIMKAVDISQIVKHRFISSLQIKHVELGTEELTSEDGRNTKVSSIDIVVTK